jgi:hypothetical protein
LQYQRTHQDDLNRKTTTLKHEPSYRLYAAQAPGIKLMQQCLADSGNHLMASSRCNSTKASLFDKEEKLPRRYGQESFYLVQQREPMAKRDEVSGD